MESRDDQQIYTVLQKKFPSPTSINHILYQELTLGEKLGEGNFGVVYSGKWKGTEVAIKKLKDVDLPDAGLQEFKKEVEILSTLHSSYVVNFYGTSQDKMQYMIVMEYCSGGTLYHRLHSTATIEWSQRRQWGEDIANGVAYLHENNIIHCDLAARNVLLNKNDHAKLTDFGLSETRNYYTNSNSSTVQPKQVPFAWTAPERLSREGAKPSKETDMYSYGVVLWEIASCQNPLSIGEMEKLDPESKIFKVREGYRDPVPVGTPQTFQEIIELCRDKSPAKRPTALQVLKQFKKYDEEKPSTGPAYDNASIKKEENKEILRGTNTAIRSHDAGPGAGGYSVGFWRSNEAISLGGVGSAILCGWLLREFNSIMRYSMNNSSGSRMVKLTLSVGILSSAFTSLWGVKKIISEKMNPSPIKNPTVKK